MTDPNKDPRIGKIIGLVSKLGTGQLDARGEISEAGDEVDAIITALNMLAEDLEAQINRRETAEGLLSDAVDIYERAPVMFFSLEFPGGTVVKCNQTAAQALGYRKEEVIGQDALKFFAEEDWPKAKENLAQFEASGRLIHTELRMRRADGTTLLAAIDASPVYDADGTLIRSRSVVRDVTTERKLESQLLHAQKMEAIGRLAGGIAHDFNNLLTVISNCASLLKPAVTGNPGATADVRDIVTATNRATELTSQLLQFSRAQAMTVESVDLNEIVMNTDRMMRRVVGSDIELVTVPEQGLWSMTADPGKIEQTLVNLLINARDAMPDGGKLVIETRNVVVGSDDPRTRAEVSAGEYVMLVVSDTGSGMAPEVAAHAFEPFYTTKKTGTGLGLSMVYGIVKQSNGHVFVDSMPGEGTSFSIYFPRVETVRRTRKDTGERRLDRGSETILLVEDEPTVRRVTSRVLRGHGYDVIEAANGEDALRIALETDRPIHLLLTDVVMPRMGGPQLWQEVKHALPQTRVLFMSGYADRRVAHSGLLETGVGFLEKPFMPTQLLAGVRRAIEE